MFSRVIHSNYVVAVLALFLSFILWLFVAGDTLFQVMPTRKIFEDIPVVYLNLGEGLLVANPEETVSLVLEGVPEVLADVKEGTLAAVVNLKGKGLGIHTVEIYINPPEGLSLVSYHPLMLEVTVTKE